jgi:hypothetical protein
MILRTNLATRPFYNERAVRLALFGFAAAVALFTLINVGQFLRLSASERRLGSAVADSEREADRLRAEAARIRTQIDPKELAVVSAAAQEANGIIDRRAFSWTELFNRFEATLPPDVRIRSVQPRTDRNSFVVAVVVEARRVEDIDAFIEALEQIGGFQNVRPVEEATTEDNLLEAVVEGVYVPPARGKEASQGD